MSEKAMKIEQWKLSDIKPYPGNPRQNDAAVDAVAASIKEFGFRQPIVVDAEELIDLFMHFVADIFTRPQAHDHQLRVLSGKQYLPEIVIFKGLFFNWNGISCHFSSPFQCCLLVSYLFR